MKPIKKHFVTIYTLTLAAALFTGCVFSGDPGTPPKETGPSTNPIAVTSCTDLPAAQQKTADSLVTLATAKMTADMEYLFSDTVDSWKTAKARDPQAALALYDQALKVAPGHCGATFGRAVASTMKLTQDPKVDAFATKAEAASNANNGSGIPKISSGRALLKLSPDQAAPVLLKLTASMNAIDYPTVMDFQELAASTLLPKLDSTIAAIEVALAYANFAFEFTTQDGRMIQLDQGDIGPLLAGLKVTKAWLTIAVGYQWELGLNGTYWWIDSIRNIQTPDFDHLRPGQKDALDHLTGLFSTSSLFSKIKPDWKTSVNGIPALLLSAVNDAQTGLRYSIAEAGKTTGQEHDLYVVGTGPNADVDPADLQEAVDLLERSKKYLSGEVPITYNKGIRTLKVNFSKLFEIDGVQGMLPYFKFRPYSEWNDTVSADTSWVTGLYGEAGTELLGKLGYDSRKDYLLSLQLSPTSYSDSNMQVTVYNQAKDTVIDSLPTYLGSSTVVATLTRDSNSPCTYHYNKSYERGLTPGATVTNSRDAYSVPDPYQSISKVSSGTIHLSLCRETNGQVEFAEYIDATTKSPMYFTNATGDSTVDVTDLGKYSDDLPALDSKIIFRDPTFGGVFPELTQSNIWTVINSLKTVEPRTKQVCEMTSDGGWGNYKCTTVKVSDPSDLDLLISVSYIMNGPL